MQLLATALPMNYSTRLTASKLTVYCLLPQECRNISCQHDEENTHPLLLFDDGDASEGGVRCTANPNAEQGSLEPPTAICSNDRLFAHIRSIGIMSYLMSLQLLIALARLLRSDVSGVASRTRYRALSCKTPITCFSLHISTCLANLPPALPIIGGK